MKSYFIDHLVHFTDKMLKPGWLKRQFQVQEDAIVSFIGPFDIHLNCHIRQPIPQKLDRMLQFVVEHKNKALREMATCQHLFLIQLCQTLGSDFCVEGTNIYYQDHYVGMIHINSGLLSSIFHIALFIEPDLPKLPIIGLEHFDISSRDFAYLMMRQYCDTIENILNTKKP